jgi:electron transport complex protein RnfD
MEIIQENSPHLRRRDNLTGMLLDVLIALAPVLVFSLIQYTWHILVNVALSMAVMCLSEFVFIIIKMGKPREGDTDSFGVRLKKSYSINNFLAPAISATLLALMMPAKYTNPTGFIYFVVITSALFGIVIGKLVFGGTGTNIFNPAAVGFVFSKVCFDSKFSGLWYDSAYNGLVDEKLSAGASVLSSGSQLETVFSSKASLLDMFFGIRIPGFTNGVPGALGETYKLAILLGLAYLLIRHVADWRVIVSYLGTFAILICFAGLIATLKQVPNFSFSSFFLTQLLSGGMLFGVTFMLTDPVTMPITQPSRILYGMIAAVSTVFIRLLGDNAEGMAFSILIANMVSPVLDYYKWSSPKFNWKNLTAMGAIMVAAIGILIWALADRLPLASAVSALASLGGIVL